jgi:hypothetical protein
MEQSFFSKEECAAASPILPGVTPRRGAGRYFSRDLAAHPASAPLVHHGTPPRGSDEPHVATKQPSEIRLAIRHGGLGLKVCIILIGKDSLAITNPLKNVDAPQGSAGALPAE